MEGHSGSPGKILWAFMRETLTLLHANNKGADQPAHPGSLISAFVTLENHCTRTAQSSCVGCSRRVDKIVYLAVIKGNILVNILLLKIFITNYCHLYEGHL